MVFLTDLNDAFNKVNAQLQNDELKIIKTNSVIVVFA